MIDTPTPGNSPASAMSAKLTGLVDDIAATCDLPPLPAAAARALALARDPDSSSDALARARDVAFGDVSPTPTAADAAGSDRDRRSPRAPSNPHRGVGTGCVPRRRSGGAVTLGAFACDRPRSR